MIALTYTVLALAPMLLAALAVVLGVVLAGVVSRRCEAPVEAAPMPGWALALDAALDEAGDGAALDVGWTAAPRRARRRQAARRVKARRTNVAKPHTQKVCRTKYGLFGLAASGVPPP